MTDAPLNRKELDELAKYDTPTICNALELVVPERRAIGFTTDTLICGFPAAKPIVGYARTALIRSTEPAGRASSEMKSQRAAYYDYIESGGPKPSITVIQDIDGPRAGTGAYWGEVQSAIHKGLGSLGVVTDGCVRDIDMWAPDFQFLAAKVCPSHAWVHLVAFAAEVNILGMRVKSGDLVHADRHGAVVIPHAAARRVPGACELMARKEAVILKAARSDGFNAAKLMRAIGEADEIH
jgi:regulator of RNase E activity RraA